MTYQVEWIPTECFLELARERGMPEGDESPMDYAEANDAARGKRVATFGEALALAEQKLPCDFFGCVRIERVFKVDNPYIGERWEADRVWHFAEGDVLDEEAPHETPSPMLYDDDAVLA